MTEGEGIEVSEVAAAVFLAVPVERVYRTLTTSAGWEAWFTRSAAVDPRPGGQLRFEWTVFDADRAGGIESGSVVQADPNRTFSFRWYAHRFPTQVRFTLEPRGDGTLLRVAETGSPTTAEDRETLAWCASGWSEALTLLRRYLEEGVTRL